MLHSQEQSCLRGIARRNASLLLGGAAKRPSLKCQASVTAQARGDAVPCRAEPVTAPGVRGKLAGSSRCSSHLLETTVGEPALASQVLVTPREASTLPSRQAESRSEKNHSSSEALQRALTILEATKDLYSYLAEYGESEVVQQQVQAALELQQQLVAGLSQLQKQMTPAVPASDCLKAVQDNVTEFISSNASTIVEVSSVGAAAIADNISSHPAEGDVYEAAHGAQGGFLSLNSPTTSMDEPVTQEPTAVWAGVAASRGQKRYMEDFHAIHSLHPEQGVQDHSMHSLDSTLIAGVYDGHGGRSTAAYAAAQLPTVLHQELRNCSSKRAAAVDQQQVFSSTFHKLDKSWAAHGHVEQSGSTAVTAMINKNNLVVANAGDSVAVLARGGCSQRLTRAHKLCCPDELARVTAAGGQVMADRGGRPRLMQSAARWQRYVAPLTLAVTRGFGDFGFKGFGGDLVIPTPFVSELQLCPADQLLLLTSDGITDVMGDDSMMEVALDAVNMARSTTDNGSELAAAAAAAVKETAAAAGAWDNLTVVALLLDWNNK